MDNPALRLLLFLDVYDNNNNKNKNNSNITLGVGDRRPSLGQTVENVSRNCHFMKFRLAMTDAQTNAVY